MQTIIGRLFLGILLVAILSASASGYAQELQRFGIGVFGTLIIITLSITIHRRIRAEKALRVSEEKYHSLVDHLNVGVFRNTGGPHGRFLQINPAMITIYGYPSVAELMEVKVTDLYQNPSEGDRFIEDLSKNGFIKNRELPMKKLDGTPIWVLCSARAMFDEKHEIRWIEGVHEDITERKQLEAQLLQAHKMEAIGTVAGGVAHDFNNILTAIIGNANLLQMKHEGNQEISYYLDPILSAAEKAAQLTRSLQAFSRKDT